MCLRQAELDLVARELCVGVRMGCLSHRTARDTGEFTHAPGDERAIAVALSGRYRCVTISLGLNSLLVDEGDARK
jgi:hypothetical protein